MAVSGDVFQTERTASAKALRQQCAWPVLETTRTPEGEGKSGGRGAGRQVRGSSRRALQVIAGLYNEWPLQRGQGGWFEQLSVII